MNILENTNLINAALTRRAKFVDFLRERNIPFKLGIDHGRGRTDTIFLMRVKFDINGKEISALFSPIAIVNAEVETAGIVIKGDIIAKWSVADLQQWVDQNDQNY